MDGEKSVVEPRANRPRFVVSLCAGVMVSCTMPNPAFQETAGGVGSAGSSSGATSEQTTAKPDPTTAGPTTGEETESSGSTTVDPSMTVDPSTTVEPTTEEPTTTEADTDQTTGMPCTDGLVVYLDLLGDTFFLNKSPDQTPLCEVPCTNLNFGLTPDSEFVHFQEHRGLYASRWANPDEIPDTELLNANLRLPMSTAGQELAAAKVLEVKRMGEEPWDIGVRNAEPAQVGDSNYICRQIDGNGCVAWDQLPEQNTPLVNAKEFAETSVPGAAILSADTPVVFVLPQLEVSEFVNSAKPYLDLILSSKNTLAPGVLRVYAGESPTPPQLELVFACP